MSASHTTTIDKPSHAPSPSAQALLSSSIYNARSATYDTEPTSIHPHQALSFLTPISPQPGQPVLDLVTGTGLVTLLAKSKIGPSGVVVGVGISKKMLSDGRQKALRDGLDVQFVNGDVEDLDTDAYAYAYALRGFLPEGAGGFDLVTCASALVLLRDPGAAVKAWAGMMAPRGRMMVDVPTEDAMVGASVMQRVGKGLGVGLPFDRSWVQSRESLSGLLVRAGLVEWAFG